MLIFRIDFKIKSNHLLDLAYICTVIVQYMDLVIIVKAVWVIGAVLFLYEVKCPCSKISCWGLCFHQLCAESSSR